MNKQVPNLLTPNQLLKKHISDPDHKVTDEELKLVKVGVDAENELEVEKRVAEKEEENHSKPHLPNPYDVV
jgi:hypothetical protein